MAKVRTRIAPSPTGDPHVGTAYIALFNRCFALQHGGEFILRIEDTDQSRSTARSEQDILNALRWLGLDWAEGPDVGGPHGPYRQSQRSDIYRQHINVLLEKGHAFHCFCTSERLDALRAQQMENKQTAGYDGHCLSLTRAELDANLAAKVPHVVRMRVPDTGECVFHDRLRGEIRIAWEQIDMQVLMKSDHLPTYHFANVVDDHLMEITHVIRGEEWINSTPKHILLYQHFGWEHPQFCHMPLLRNPDKSKLSKRKNPTSISYYRDMGYMPEAMINYLGMMGWTMPDGREKFSIGEMQAAFDIDRVSLGGPVFDVAKLDWLNGKYIRENLSAEGFAEAFSKWAFSPEKIQKIIPLLKDRVERFSDVVPLAGFFLSGLLPVSASDFEHKQLSPEQCRKILQLCVWQLEQIPDWSRESVEQVCQRLAAFLGIKIRETLFPLFVAITGKAVSTSVIDSIYILGLDVGRARIRHAIEVLGGVSKKEVKELEKSLRELQSFSLPEIG
ncbi:MAG: glutamate--tRNA ligase [Pseudohongiella sp.]|nr:glutamate--tRNA ligase [Pseudohongiella sp.]